MHFNSRIVLFAVMTLVVGSSRVDAQWGMSFSVYTDVVESSGTVYAHSSTLDNSWGCTHSGYSVALTLTSPTNRVASSVAGGLYANASLPIGSDYGTYVAGLAGHFDCSCLGYTTSFFGDNIHLPVNGPPHVTVATESSLYDSPINGVIHQRLDRYYQIWQFNWTPWSQGGYVDEEWPNSLISNPCNLPLSINDDLPVNQNGAFPDTYAISKPAACQYSCIVDGTQYYKLSTFSFNVVRKHRVEYACNSISVLQQPH